MNGNVKKAKDKNIYLKKIETIGQYSVWLVDGACIRKAINENFVEYDHHYNHTFIPKNEIWIDEVLTDDEINFIVLHELHERFLMSQGKKYSDAHKSATLVEDYYRDHPEELGERIRKEVENNK